MQRLIDWSKKCFWRNYALFVWFEICIESYLQTRVILSAHKISYKQFPCKFSDMIIFSLKLAMFSLLLEWLLIIFARKFHLRDSQNTCDKIMSGRRSKCTGVKWVLCIPFILGRSPCITRLWYIRAIVPHLGYITAHDRSMVEVSSTTEGGKNTASFLFH